MKVCAGGRGTPRRRRCAARRARELDTAFHSTGKGPSAQARARRTLLLFGAWLLGGSTPADGALPAASPEPAPERMDPDQLRFSFLEDQLWDELDLPDDGADRVRVGSHPPRSSPIPPDGLPAALRIPLYEDDRQPGSWSGGRGSSEMERSLCSLLPSGPRAGRRDPPWPGSLGGATDAAWPPGLLDPEAYDIPIVANHLVLRYLRFYLERGRPSVARWLARSGRVAPAILRSLEAYGLPRDLLYVPMIESGFSASAVSPRRATGYWQFMPVTGRAYGLRIDGWVDERLDPERSTDAAGRHLQDLYDLFGSWELALAAYNGGIGRIGRAIVRYNSNDFWTLARYDYLPSETVHYVAKVMAAAILDHHREQLGFGGLVIEQPPAVREVRPAPGLTLQTVARRLQVKESTLAELNPWLLRRMVPRTGPLPRLVVPASTTDGKGLTSPDRLAEIPEADSPPFTTHTVQLGETLGDIARLFGVYPALISRLNQVEEHDELLPGQQLLVPMATKGRSPVPKAADGRRIVFVPPLDFSYPDREKVFFPIPRRTLSLAAVAATFGVQEQEILMWNDLDPAARLWPGMVLRLYLPKKGPRPAAKLLPARAVEEVVVDSRRFHDELRRTGAARTPRKQAGRYRYHRVAEGETFEQIASKYGVPPERLAETNRLRPDRLQAGHVLRIPYPERGRTLLQKKPVRR